MVKTAVKTAPSRAPAFLSASIPSPIDQLPPGFRSSGSTGRLVLVIDGSPTIQKIIELALRQEGYEVGCFRNGIDAMRWFAGPQARIPDLMLVDLDLPKLDGCRVIQKFKSKPCFAHTACLVLREREITDEAYLEQIGAAGSLCKPFTIQELITATQTTIANSLKYAPN